MVLINGNRNGYDPEQCGRTLTVGELIDTLREYGEDEKVFLCHDGGYTYGSIEESDLDHRYEEPARSEPSIRKSDRER